VSLIKPQGDAGDVDEGEKVAARLLVASGDGAEALQAVKEAFDAIAHCIETAVLGALASARRIRCDDRLDFALANSGYELV